MAKYILETNQMRLREFTLDNTAFIIALVNSPGWIKFIGQRNITTESQARAYLESGPLHSYKEHGFGLSLVELKATSEPIGMCGILKREHLESPDIGFAFLPQWVGKGLAYEIAAATMEYARDALGQDAILAVTLPDNEKSIRLLTKLGMQFCRPIAAPAGGGQLSLYSNS